MNKVFAFGIVSVMSLSAFATEYERESTVTGYVAFGKARPGLEKSQNVFRVYIAPVSWSSCRTDAVDIPGQDRMLQAALLSALAKDRNTVKITVDDSLKPVDDTCQVTAIDARLQ